MLYWALIFFVIGIIASLFGFGSIAGFAYGVAKGLVVLKVIGIICILVAIGFTVAHLRGPARLRSRSAE